MASSRLCSKADCGKPARALGLCVTHYARQYRLRSPEERAWRKQARLASSRERLQGGKKDTRPPSRIEFVKSSVLSYQGNDCLKWPFSRNPKGYGQIWVQGRVRRVHRVVCELVFGPPSSSGLVAAHSCGNGHLGCVNPKHIRWATVRENVDDMIAHGRAGGSHARKWQENDVRYIRESPKSHIPQLAKEFGLSVSTIYDIRTRRIAARFK